MAQSKASLRRKVRSALADVKSADDILEAITLLQTTLNELLTKMDGDIGISDTDYSDLSVDETELD